MSYRDSLARMISTFLRYATAVLSVAVILLLVLLLQPRPESSGDSVAFVVAIVISSLYGGSGAGTLASVLAVVAINYFLAPPYLSAKFDFGDLMRLGIFAMVALLIGWLQEGLRQEAEKREHLAIQLEAALAKHERLEPPISFLDSLSKDEQW
ncbi:MAG: DUF4118 domain-containing protein [Acidobacteria bacterium]|nr:DUF4118 domain-containing protein [Acidobacteriota bacterium]